MKPPYKGPQYKLGDLVSWAQPQSEYNNEDNDLGIVLDPAPVYVDSRVYSIKVYWFVQKDITRPSADCEFIKIIETGHA